MLAAYKLRAIPINLNHRYVAEELRYHFDDASPVVVLTEPDLADRVEAAGPPPHVLVRGEAYEAALAASSPERIEVPDRSNDDIYLLYTGGTTGMPKGVMWRHEDLFFGVVGGAGVPRRGIPRLDDPADIGAWARKGTGVDRRLPLAPLMHGLAQWTALTTLFTGGTLFLDGDRHFDAARALTFVAEERIQLIQLVGDVLALRIADELERNGGAYDLAELQMISSSGAVLSPSVQAGSARAAAADPGDQPLRRLRDRPPGSGRPRQGRGGPPPGGRRRHRGARRGLPSRRPGRHRPAGPHRRHPPGLLGRPGEDGPHLPRRRRRALVGAGGPGPGGGRRLDRGPRARARWSSTRGARRSSPRRSRPR